MKFNPSMFARYWTCNECGYCVLLNADDDVPFEIHQCGPLMSISGSMSAVIRQGHMQPGSLFKRKYPIS